MPVGGIIARAQQRRDHGPRERVARRPGDRAAQLADGDRLGQLGVCSLGHPRRAGPGLEPLHELVVAAERLEPARGGQATSADYASIGTSVVIPDGQRSVTLPVTASPDTNATEGNETVTLTLAEDANRYKTSATSKTATVTILDRQKYFVYFYGTGGPFNYGDNWLDKLAAIQRDSHGYTLIGDIGRGGFAENRGSRALRTLFQRINADGAKTISAAEAESADVQAAGWSLGASQAVNFTYYLSRVGPWVADYKLMAAVPVKALVTWDPAVKVRLGAVEIPALKTLKTVQNNVQKFRNYYQQRAGTTFFQQVSPGGAVVGLSRRFRTGLDSFVIGNSVPVNLPPARVQQDRVDVNSANLPEERDRIENPFERDAVGDLNPVYEFIDGEPRCAFTGTPHRASESTTTH